MLILFNPAQESWDYSKLTQSDGNEDDEDASKVVARKSQGL